MAQRLLILLLGGREQPALLTAAHVEPDVVLCIAPFKSDKPPAVARWLGKFMPHVDLLEPLEVSPYRPQETSASILAAARAHRATATMVSIISAPMPMGIGGYQAAMDLGCPAYYLDTGTKLLLDMTGRIESEPISIGLGIREFALVNNVRVRDDAPRVDWSKAQQKHKAARTALRADMRAATALLNWLPRTETSFTWKGDWTLSDPVAPGARALLDALSECGVISSLQWSTADGKVQVKMTVKDRADALFLASFWLEQFVHEAGSAALLPDGTPLFDDCAWGVSFDAQGKAHREVDFIGVRGGTGLIASCKTAIKCWEKPNVDEIVSVSSLWGGNYLATMYVTNQFRPQRGDKLYQGYVEFTDWAARQNVTVVTGDDLPNLEAILVEAATQRVRR